MTPLDQALFAALEAWEKSRTLVEFEELLDAALACGWEDSDIGGVSPPCFALRRRVAWLEGRVGELEALSSRLASEAWNGQSAEHLARVAVAAPNVSARKRRGLKTGAAFKLKTGSFPMDEPKPTRSTCRFAARTERLYAQWDGLECRRNPPIMVRHKSSCAEWQAPGWVDVRKDQWCGEHKPKETDNDR